MLYWFQWLLFPIIVVFCPIKNTIQSLRPCQRDSKAKSNCCISIVATYEIGINGSFNYSTYCFQGNFFQLQGWSHKLTKRCKHYFNTEQKCLSRFREANLTYNILYEIVSFGLRFPWVPAKQQLWALGYYGSCFPSSWVSFDLTIYSALTLTL